MSDMIFHPQPQCEQWSCKTDQEAKNLSIAELETQLQVQVIARINVSRDSLAAGQRVEFEIPLSGFNQYYFPRQPFQPNIVTVDLTGFFISLFANIDQSIREDVYPDLTL